MSIGRIDLNLIKVFDAVYEDRNLLRAGKRLNLSQSAVSHALTRLREVVGDELFVRTSKGMVPTARSAAMADGLRDSLRRIEATLGVEPFDPGKSTCRFAVAANDHLTAVMVAELSRLMAVEAPGIDLVVKIDIAVGIFAQVPFRRPLRARRARTRGPDDRHRSDEHHGRRSRTDRGRAARRGNAVAFR
jgi:DNA-binding transcriptional LysR family regulator